MDILYCVVWKTVFIRVAHGLGLYWWSMDGIIYKGSPRYNLQPGQGSMIDQ